eukprot:jgi/Chrzof1/12752/Cz07g06080.t1
MCVYSIVYVLNWSTAPGPQTTCRHKWINPPKPYQQPTLSRDASVLQLTNQHCKERIVTHLYVWWCSKSRMRLGCPLWQLRLICVTD